jgi:hypothetical protein
MKPQFETWAAWYDARERAYRQDPCQGTMKDLEDALVYLSAEGKRRGWPQVGQTWSGQHPYYVAMRLDGAPHTLAEMLALQSPPMSNTDREFLHGVHENDDVFASKPGLYEHFKKIADSQGVDITGKRYVSGLARYPGDPRAFVSGRGDVERICREEGWNCRGAVNVTSEVRSAPVQVGVAEDIVQEKVLDTLESHPEPEKVNLGELSHQVRQALTPHWAK